MVRTRMYSEAGKAARIKQVGDNVMVVQLVGVGEFAVCRRLCPSSILLELLRRPRSAVLLEALMAEVPRCVGLTC